MESIRLSGDRLIPIYPISCANCGEQETFATMSHARANDLLDCPVCQRPRPRLIVLPNYQEDRLRFWKGPMGNGWSTALGAPMPGSIAERDRMAEAKGVEFCGVSEFLAGNAEAAEAVDYKRYVDSGGHHTPVLPADTSPFVTKPAWANDLVG